MQSVQSLGLLGLFMFTFMFIFGFAVSAPAWCYLFYHQIFLTIFLLLLRACVMLVILSSELLENLQKTICDLPGPIHVLLFGDTTVLWTKVGMTVGAKSPGGWGMQFPTAVIFICWAHIPCINCSWPPGCSCLWQIVDGGSSSWWGYD